MILSKRSFIGLLASAAIMGCAADPSHMGAIPLHAGETPEMRVLIRKWAKIHDIPETLLHRIIQRESHYRANARNGPYYGLMQILPQTARGMGYRGDPAGLLNAETNLEFAGKYLKGAWIVSGKNEDKAVMWYAKGYYYEAKRLGLLEKTGLRT
jgi:soluble lytic murein transglycosylase-like protein